MNYADIEYNLVLAGWLIALLLGIILLIFKTPDNEQHVYYEKGKNICAAALLIFGSELLFQWLIRFYLKLSDPVLSVSVYLFSFCAATLLITAGFCAMLAPEKMNRTQRALAAATLGVYSIILLFNKLMISNRSTQVTLIIVSCALLFIINCIAIYKCIYIYRWAINRMRTYYSDFMENLMRWMPGVGVGIMIFLISAPITCLCPKIVGIYQLALGIIMFIYTFVSIINFSFRYSTVATALVNNEIHNSDDDMQQQPDDDTNGPATTANGGSTLSDTLCQIMQEKEQRWQQRGGYRTPGITIEQAARDIGTNRNYLSRYLNEVKNVTFYEWVAQMRINEALSLMQADPNATIEHIAGQVGFSSSSAFSATFKKVVGITPNQWRNRQ